jgi:hypothetical protein
MKNKNLRLIVASVVGLASDFRPVPGMLGAALVVPQGIESDHGLAYLVLALGLNFALFFGATYFLFGLFSKHRISN